MIYKSNLLTVERQRGFQHIYISHNKLIVQVEIGQNHSLNGEKNG